MSILAYPARGIQASMEGVQEEHTRRADTCEDGRGIEQTVQVKCWAHAAIKVGTVRGEVCTESRTKGSTASERNRL
mgnify:CR=1 FL=1